jgi:hypothetical protein
VLMDELAPGALPAPWCRLEAIPAEHSTNGQVGATRAELEELALDAAIAPARVLPCQAEDQLVQLAPEQWSPTRSCSVASPLPADQFPVPAEQRLGADEQRRPGRTSRIRLKAVSRRRSTGCQRGRRTWRSSTRS